MHVGGGVLTWQKPFCHALSVRHGCRARADRQLINTQFSTAFIMSALVALLVAARGLNTEASCVLQALRDRVDLIRSASRQPAVLHIGANLAFGNRNDPLRPLYRRLPSDLRVILVEPQPAIAARLRNMTSRMQHVHVAEAAVCSDVSHDHVTFYGINRTKAAALKGKPVFFLANSQVASLDRQQIVKSKKIVKEIESLIEEIQVQCMSVAGILQRYGIRSNELAGLVIDAEGHDARILASIDWADNQLRPQLLIFERTAMASGELKSSVQLMSRAGYNCSRVRDKENVWCQLGGGPERAGHPGEVLPRPKPCWRDGYDPAYHFALDETLGVGSTLAASSFPASTK